MKKSIYNLCGELKRNGRNASEAIEIMTIALARIDKDAKQAQTIAREALADVNRLLGDE